MSRRGALLVCVAVLATVLSLWVTAASPVRLAERTPPSSVTTYLPNGEVERIARDPVLDRPSNHTADIVISSLLALMLIPLLAFLLAARHFRGRTRDGRRPDGGRGSAAFAIPDALDETAEALAAAAQDELTEMQGGTPRNAIVACWVRLEEAAVSAGLRRNVAETSAEFTTRVLGVYAVDREAITTLAALYREARFSEHELGEHHRRAAIAALAGLYADLAARSHRFAGAAPSGGVVP